MRTVRFYFDFISPYSWLALMEARAFAEAHDVAWEMRPVVYGKLLDETGLVGPAETRAKRRYTFHDIARHADRRGLKLVGPPAHPFRSLEALRTVVVFRDEPSIVGLCAAISDATWGGGLDLTDVEVLSTIVREHGLDPGDLAERIAAQDVKHKLRDWTQEALDLGVFGVPTFVYERELFWGQDRLPDLVRRIDGTAPPSNDLVRSIAERPRGIDRKGAPR
ncbi:MAG: 2-hydroxychromene-2-carboxylate isomerase [Acidobacteriota bacterium]|nr:2-hydroxychromene-2-carboxylate isomerase [Acidobacteriota bacterium]